MLAKKSWLKKLVHVCVGILKIWSLGSRTCVFQQPVHKSLSVSSNIEECETHGDSVIQAALCQNIQAIAIVTADHNILLYSFDGLKQVKQVWVIYKHFAEYSAQ